MGKRFLGALLTLCCLSVHLVLVAQDSNPYVLNGSAHQVNCHCYTLTDEVNNEVGSVWNKYKIDLTQSFDFKFTVFLGCKDQDGADGIAFVLQPISTSIGTDGQGLGFGGVSPSIGIVIDTWQNPDYGDPPYDHIGIYKNGDLNNYDTNRLAGPFGLLSTATNIEDCQWHNFEIIWDAPNKSLSGLIGGIKFVQLNNVDIVNDIFKGDPNVYWGFTGATGGENNRQGFCTSLDASFNLSANQNSCYPTQIDFVDSSSSFGTIKKWYWDFGDGTIDSVENPSPHVYPAPGNYIVKLNIVGNDGCLSDTIQHKITIGSKPVADFGYASPKACSAQPVDLVDRSSVQFGTINNWSWDINNGQTLLNNSSGGLQQNFSPGTQSIALVVSTAEGCVSDTTYHSLQVFSSPSVSLDLSNACAGDPVTLSAPSTDPSVTIREWYWQLGDETSDSSQTIVHTYAKGGEFDVGIIAVSDEGCRSDSLTGVVNIYQTHAFAGDDTVAVIGEPLQLHASGGVLYRWDPSTGLNDNTIPDPLATLQHDATYVLTAYTTVGCPSYDTIDIKAYKGPAIYVPSAFTPNNDGHNDKFKCVPVGITHIDFFNIFNRYGQLVYTSTDPTQGWDGNFNGSAAPTGAYVWMIKGEDDHGKSHFEKGTVVLIR